MSNIKARVTDAARGAAPWRRGIPWWIVLGEGVILVALGLYMLFAGSSANTLLGWGVALALLAGGALSVYLSLQATRQSPAQRWTMIHGLVGVIGGGLLILLQLFNVLTPRLGVTLLGVGCLAYGLVGLYMLVEKNLLAVRRLSVVETVIFLTLGGLLLLQALGVGALATMLQLINLVILTGGVALIIWGFALRNSAAR